MKAFCCHFIVITVTAMLMVCPVWSNRVQKESHPRIAYAIADPASLSFPVEEKHESIKEDQRSLWPKFYEQMKAAKRRSDGRTEEEINRSLVMREDVHSKTLPMGKTIHQDRRPYASSEISRQKSLRFIANEQVPSRENERITRYSSKSTYPQSYRDTQQPQATVAYQEDLISHPSEVETGRSLSMDIKRDPTKFFHDREERKKLSYKSRNGARELDTLKIRVTTPSEIEEDDDVTTEGMTVIATSSSPLSPDDDRMSLIRGRDRDRPRLIFLADDPEAASRIPILMSTNYDSNSRLAHIEQGFRHEMGRSGVITSPTVDDELKFYTTISDDRTTYLSNGIEREIDLSHKNYRAVAGDHSDYFPSRYRPSIESDHRPYIGYSPAGTGSGFSKIRPMKNMTRVTHIEAECQDDFMRIHVRFNGSFQGLVYSSEYSHDLDCVYINGSGKHGYDFFIKLNRCGTLGTNDFGDKRRPMQKNVMWNTLTVQYNPLIEEEWDEHFKVTCEYGLEIWNTVTFPFLDVEVQTGNPMMFTLSPPECHMEIRYGFGPDGSRVTSPVRVGDPLTLVIYMRSQYDGFDIVVSDCFAHNGGSKRIMLIDSYGCPVDDKLISHFDGQSLRDGVYETQVFAFMKTFRFTGSPALYIECGVRMCHGDCPTQLCHWRRSRKGKSRRSVSESATTATTASPSVNVSDSVNLFQSLQVIRDDDNSRPKSYLVTDSDEFCFKSNNFMILVGMAGALLGICAVACLILCMRLRSLGKIPDSLQVPQAPLQRGYRSDFIPPSKRRLE